MNKKQIINTIIDLRARDRLELIPETPLKVYKKPLALRWIWEIKELSRSRAHECTS